MSNLLIDDSIACICRMWHTYFRAMVKMFPIFRYSLKPQIFMNIPYSIYNMHHTNTVIYIKIYKYDTLRVAPYILFRFLYQNSYIFVLASPKEGERMIWRPSKMVIFVLKIRKKISTNTFNGSKSSISSRVSLEVISSSSFNVSIPKLFPRNNVHFK